MEVILSLTWLIPLFPLLATAVITFVPAVYYRKKLSARLTIGMMALSLVLSLLVFVATVAHPETLVRLEGHEAVEAPAGETGEVHPAPAEAAGEELFIPPKPIFEREFPWLSTGRFFLEMGFWVDPLTAAMLVMVSLVGLCIFIYSQGYMAAEDYQGEDQRYSRFFSFLGLFAASMLGLVIADNILLLFICWELVGLCSYLLIGFWNFKKSAYDAAIKAFIVTKIGDAGFFIGIFLLYIYTDNMSIGYIIHHPEVLNRLAHTSVLGIGSVAALAAIGLFIGTIGKSAQVPLHVWLPDAMEGPTPVSALIHAATMVAAGVFLVARMFPLFQAAGAGTMNLVAWIGGITAIFAATIAIAQYDIKRVLAYSTISQLGFMVLALGLGGYVAGFFHLITHAFFKALLFLGSGAVIIGAHHVQDMREMGGLWKRLPYTFWTYLIGMLALAGIFPLSGFFSKDEILLDAFQHNTALYIIATIAAFITSFYMTRQMFYVFAGKPRSHGAEAAAEVPLFGRELALAAPADPHGGHGHGEHGPGGHAAHGGPLPLNMTVPLMVLAAGTALLSVVGLPLGEGTPFSRFVGGHADFSPLVAGVSTLVALAGIGAGYLVYGRNLLKSAHDPDPLQALLERVSLGRLRLRGKTLDLRLSALYTLWEKKYYVDEIYGFLFVQGSHLLARVSAWFDLTVIDGAVNGAARLSRLLSSAFGWFDLEVVDGLVNLIGWFGRVFSALQGWVDLHIVDGLINAWAMATGWVGDRLRRIQTGLVQDYLMLVLLGIALIVGLFILL
ncbi:MAG: NADH-quinone oxidoreductase subunit L [Chloroflexia bacterium]